MKPLSNYPPGVTGNEPQITGEDDSPATVEEVVDFISTCIGECDADSYQQQEQSAIHRHKIDWSQTDRKLFITVGGDVFVVKVSKSRRS